VSSVETVCLYNTVVVDFVDRDIMLTLQPQFSQQAQPLLSESGLVRLTLYFVPRCFDDDAKLHGYLARKCPTLILEKRQYYKNI